MQLKTLLSERSKLGGQLPSAQAVRGGAYAMEAWLSRGRWMGRHGRPKAAGAASTQKPSKLLNPRITEGRSDVFYILINVIL